jgi:hypothetical protein
MDSPRLKIESLIDDMMQAHSDMLDYPWHDNTYKMLKADVQIAREALIAYMQPEAESTQMVREQGAIMNTPLNCNDRLHPGDLLSGVSRKTRIRYRLKCGPTTYHNGRGWRSKADVDSWLAPLIQTYGLEYRVGYYVKLVGFEFPFSIVNSKGEELKP